MPVGACARGLRLKMLRQHNGKHINCSSLQGLSLVSARQAYLKWDDMNKEVDNNNCNSTRGL